MCLLSSTGNEAAVATGVLSRCPLRGGKGFSNIADGSRGACKWSLASCLGNPSFIITIPVVVEIAGGRVLRIVPVLVDLSSISS